MKKNKTIILTMLWTLIVIIAFGLITLGVIYTKHSLLIGSILGGYWVHMIKWMKSLIKTQD